MQDEYAPAVPCLRLLFQLACRNVLIDDSGTVKISDFGLSRRVGSGPDSAGATQSNIGPIRWMAPENFSKSYSSKSDVWYVRVLSMFFSRLTSIAARSFACTMVELISGSAPHMHLDLLECALRIRCALCCSRRSCSD